MFNENKNQIIKIKNKKKINKFNYKNNGLYLLRLKLLIVIKIKNI